MTPPPPGVTGGRITTVRGFGLACLAADNPSLRAGVSHFDGFVFGFASDLWTRLAEPSSASFLAIGFKADEMYSPSVIPLKTAAMRQSSNTSLSILTGVSDRFAIATPVPCVIRTPCLSGGL